MITEERIIAAMRNLNTEIVALQRQVDSAQSTVDSASNQIRERKVKISRLNRLLELVREFDSLLEELQVLDIEVVGR